MFTGIVTEQGIISSVKSNKGYSSISIICTKKFLKGLKKGASVAVNGVCLTSKKSKISNKAISKNLKKKHKRNKKYKKATIPKAVREQTWIKTFGETFKHKCYISWCTNEINVFDFHVGHDKPESKGGTLGIDNLKPIFECFPVGFHLRHPPSLDLQPLFSVHPIRRYSLSHPIQASD